MYCRDDRWAGLVNPTVNGYRRCINWPVAFHNLTRFSNANQILSTQFGEMDSISVHPESIMKLRIPHGDVPGDTLGQPQFPENSESCCEGLLTVFPLLGVARECFRDGQCESPLVS